MGLISCAVDINEAEQDVRIEDELKPLRASHARYNDINNALADGYQLGYRGAAADCVRHPTLGAMGYHYFNWAKMEDPTIDEMAPEVLVYHTRDGELKLGAVEWVVPKSLWDAAGNTTAPVVYGRTLHIINPVLNWYLEHAWVFVNNPAGTYMDWNSDVHCP
jgi:hypothetical protein